MEDIKVIEKYLPADKADGIFKYLLADIKWNSAVFTKNDNTKIELHRKVAYVSDSPTNYEYANFYFAGETWNDLLWNLKRDLEFATGHSFNSVLLNLYNDGKDEIKWHSDKERTLGDNPVIVCVNLGASRKFWFREKTYNSEKFYKTVNNGDLLIMGEDCQKKYLHAILKEPEVKDPRISLTFRYNYPNVEIKNNE